MSQAAQKPNNRNETTTNCDRRHKNPKRQLFAIIFETRQVVFRNVGSTQKIPKRQFFAIFIIFETRQIVFRNVGSTQKIPKRQFFANLFITFETPWFFRSRYQLKKLLINYDSKWGGSSPLGHFSNMSNICNFSLYQIYVTFQTYLKSYLLSKKKGVRRIKIHNGFESDSYKLFINWTLLVTLPSCLILKSWPHHVYVYL